MGVTQKRFLMQFTLRQLLLFVLLVAGFLASVVQAGIYGPQIFFTLLSIILMIVAVVKRQRRYGAVAVVMFFGSILFLSVSLKKGKLVTKPLTLAILAADDGAPLAQAKVRIRTIDDGRVPIPMDPVPADERGIEDFTDIQGLITMTGNFRYWSRDSLFMRERKVDLRNYWIQVFAPGYEPAIFSLAQLIAEDVPANSFPKSTIVLKLKRLTSGP